MATAGETGSWQVAWRAVLALGVTIARPCETGLTMGFPDLVAILGRLRVLIMRIGLLAALLPAGRHITWRRRDRTADDGLRWPAGEARHD